MTRKKTRAPSVNALRELFKAASLAEAAALRNEYPGSPAELRLLCAIRDCGFVDDQLEADIAALAACVDETPSNDDDEPLLFDASGRSARR